MTEKRDVFRKKDLGPLHDLLLKAAPRGEDGRKPAIGTLAKALGITRWSIFVWIKNNKVPPRWVKQIVKISENRVAIEDFLPYTFV